MVDVVKESRRGIALCGVAWAMAVLYSAVVPLGEAPDEGAHLYFLERLAGESELPRFSPVEAPLSYEAHQPPLDYAIVAGAASAIGVLPTGYPLAANPGLDFETPGSRATLEIGAPPGAVRSLHLVRWLRALWLLPTALVILATARRVGGNRRGAAMAGVASVVLCPQLLFTSGTVNNDGAVTFFAGACLLLLLQLESSESPAVGRAALAGGTAAFAVLSKGTGLALLAPLALVAYRHGWRGRRPAVAAALLLPALAGGLALLGLNEWRFGSPGFAFPAEPGHEAGAALRRLVEEPGWIATLDSSFWARFGWFNLPLPIPAYLLFVPASALAVGGLSAALGRSRSGAPQEEAGARDRRAARLAVSLLAANLALVIGHMVLIAWQPQGRLLFSSLGALCVLVTLGARRVLSLGESRRWRGARHALPAVLVAVGLAANALSLWWILRAYE